MQLTINGTPAEIEELLARMYSPIKVSVDRDAPKGEPKYEYIPGADGATPLEVFTNDRYDEALKTLNRPLPSPADALKEIEERKAQVAAEGEEREKRKRRTKAEMEAARANPQGEKVENLVTRTREAIAEFPNPPAGEPVKVKEITIEMKQKVLQRVLASRGAAIAQSIIKNASGGAMRWSEVDPACVQTVYDALSAEADRAEKADAA